jgi:hypothetical protein
MARLAPNFPTLSTLNKYLQRTYKLRYELVHSHPHTNGVYVAIGIQVPDTYAYRELLNEHITLEKLNQMFLALGYTGDLKLVNTLEALA